MIQDDNRLTDEVSQLEKSAKLEDDFLFYAGYLFLAVLFWQSWLRYDSGSRPLTGSEWGSYALATLLIFCNYFFPRKNLKVASIFIFIVSLFFSLSATTESIDNVFNKNKKPILVEKKTRDELPANCPSAALSWVNWDECNRKSIQAEAERLEYNKAVGEFNATLPTKNAKIEKHNSELTYERLALQSQLSIILYILLAIGIPSLEMYSVYVLHKSDIEKGSPETVKLESFFTLLRKTFKPDLTEGMRQLIVLRKWDVKTTTDKLQSIGFTNVEIAKILDLHKSTITRKQKESRRQPVLFVVPSKRDNKQPDLFGNVKEA